MLEHEIVEYALFGLGFYCVGALGFGLMVAARLSPDFGFLRNLPKEEARDEIQNTAEEVLEEAIGERLGFLFDQSGRVVEPDWLSRITHDLIPNSSCSVSELSSVYWRDLFYNGTASQTFADALAVLEHLQAIM